MKKNKYIFFIISLLFVLEVQGQQDPHFSLYKYNRNVINPSYAGANDRLEAMFGMRNQWVNIPGAPETFNFNVNSPIGKSLGLGASIVQDKVYVVSETHMYADFSHKLALSDNLDLFSGLKVGGSILNVDLQKLSIKKDPLFAENVSRFNPNVGVGFYLRSKDSDLEKYYVTVSVPGLLRNDRYEKKGLNPSHATDHIGFFVGGGYNVPINDKFLLQPSILTKLVSGAPASVDLTASILFDKRLEFGVNYRLEESYTGFITMEFLGASRIGYAFEQTITATAPFNSGTHEIVFILTFPKKKKKATYRLPTNYIPCRR